MLGASLAVSWAALVVAIASAIASHRRERRNRRNRCRISLAQLEARCTELAAELEVLGANDDVEFDVAYFAHAIEPGVERLYQAALSASNTLIVDDKSYNEWATIPLAAMQLLIEIRGISRKNQPNYCDVRLLASRVWHLRDYIAKVVDVPVPRPLPEAVERALFPKSHVNEQPALGDGEPTSSE